MGIFSIVFETLRKVQLHEMPPVCHISNRSVYNTMSGILLLAYTSMTYDMKTYIVVLEKEKYNIN